MRIRCLVTCLLYVKLYCILATTCLIFRYQDLKNMITSMMCCVYVLQTCSWSYDPGDTIGVVCPNDVSEVRSLLDLLGLSDKVDVTCSLEVLSDTRKRNASVPEHLPVKSTLFNCLHSCCEIREVPRKVGHTALTDNSTSLQCLLTTELLPVTLSVFNSFQK